MTYLIVLQALEGCLLVPQTAVSLQNLSKWTGCNCRISFLHLVPSKKETVIETIGTLKVRTATSSAAFLKLQEKPSALNEIY
jgi:hypothetical protein